MERIRTRPIDTIEPEEWFTEDIMWQVTRFNAFVAENSQFPNWQALRDYAKHKFFGYI